MKLGFTLFFFFSLVSCSGGLGDSLSDSFRIGEEDSSDSGGNPPAPSEPMPEDIAAKLWICSDLNFQGVYAPDSYSVRDINMYALALNISGSFEGPNQWKNITNNFDGMGLSLGLLNQTLGTGSLQPLLENYRTEDIESMQQHFSIENFAALEEMLNNYQVSGQSKNNRLSVLDIEIYGAKEDASVDWALDHLYSDNGRTFKVDWKTSLQEMAESSKYREIQMNAAKRLHTKAVNYMALFDLVEIRSYLFLFDIVVQNGGFYQSNIDEYRSYLSTNPQANERDRLEFLLTSRLQQVRRQYRDDVRYRKQSLIDGQGRVHGANRNYETQHCYQGEVLY